MSHPVHVDGVDLRTVLREFARRRRRLVPQLGAWIVHEVLDALDYAEHVTGVDGRPLGVIHGHLSPPSVRLGVRGDIKLVYLGGDAKAPELSPEHYGYMSPEHVLEQPLDSRSDLFGVGVILAELVMGRRLFVAANETDLLLLVRDANLKRLDSFGAVIEPGLSTIIRRALARNPNDRWQSAALFCEAIAEWLFDNKHRMTARDVVELVRELDHETPSPAGPSSIQISYELHAADQTGPIPVRDLPRPTAEQVLRTPPPTPPALAQITSPPDTSGDLATTPPLRVLFRLMSARATGLLAVSVGGIKKDLYLKKGQPQSMTSNVASELFGNYLVSKNILSDGELAMALATMPHYGGKLGDTLVGLRLLEPVDVVRHLTRQVQAKLVDVCTWSRGSFAWYADQTNPLDAFPLGLDAFEVLGAGAAALPDSLVERWLGQQAAVRPQLARPLPVALDKFGLEGLGELARLLDGTRTIGQVVERFDRAEGVAVARMLYLLDACELAGAR